MPAKARPEPGPRFRLPRDERIELIRQAQQYLVDEFDLEPGDLAVELLLEHLGTLLAPVLYNRAIEDARKVVSERAITIDEELFGLSRQPVLPTLEARKPD